MKVYLDINIGDLTAHAEDQAAYSATHEFFARNSAALGLSGSSLAELDAEGQELLSDSFRSRCPDQVRGNDELRYFLRHLCRLLIAA